MKYLKFTLCIYALLVIGSCKKSFVFNPANLPGTWSQVAPYPPGAYDSLRYVFQFTTDSIFVSSPYVTRGAYSLESNNKKIKVDCNISEGPSCAGFGIDSFQIETGSNSLTFMYFFNYISLSGPLETANLYLQKTN